LRAVTGRRCELRDISALGQHIGWNYLNLVDEKAVRAAASEAMADATKRLGDVYAVSCEACGQTATLSRTIWSVVYECGHCHEPINYYEAFKATTNWKKSEMRCPSCQRHFSTRGCKRIAEEPGGRHHLMPLLKESPRPTAHRSADVGHAQRSLLSRRTDR
jgi:hypothetical protein